MKKAVMLLVVLCALVPQVFSQTIKTSPLEGYWVWDEKGEDEPEAAELVFFGNVMLIKEYDQPLIRGVDFTLDGEYINCGDTYILWQYRIAGNVLSVITEYDEQFSYTKTKPVKSPLEGIWKVLQYNNEPLDGDGFVLFTGDIMVMGVYGFYEGGQIVFAGKYLYSLLDSENRKNLTEEDMIKIGMKYSIKEKNLILSTNDEEMVLSKIY